MTERIPVDIHKGEKICRSYHDTIACRRKVDQNFIVSGGLHGVGVSVVKAGLKTRFNYLPRSKEYFISFKNGKTLNPIKFKKNKTIWHKNKISSIKRNFFKY